MAEVPPKQVPFHYIKSNFHRTIHVDGAQGSVAPQGGVTITLFSERFPIPKRMVQRVSDTGELMPEIIDTEGRDGIVRELEVTMNVAPETARRIGNFFIQRADEAENLRKLKDGGDAK